ncbi:MAG: hypothetical protein WA853_03145 [Candidatus Acidiferrum sp.]
MKSTPKYILVIAIVGLNLLTCCSSGWTYQQTFELNGLKLGDKLSDFRAKFPGMACGTPVSPEAVNRKTLDDPADPGTVTCCVDDPAQLAVFSHIQIVSIDSSCRLMVAFSRYRLHSVRYVLDPDSLGEVLEQFVKIYGPAHKTDVLPFGPKHSSDIAYWQYGGDVMELNFATIRGDDMTDPLYKKTKTDYLKIISVDMWRD